jgi:hypothetical protein
MSKREAFLIRVDPKILAAVRRWADDDLRSVNAQIDYLLRRALKQAGRMPGVRKGARPDDEPGA